MNAVAALCHFCEVHGPSVLVCTQGFASRPALARVSEHNAVDCEACCALPIATSGGFCGGGCGEGRADALFSEDAETGIWFLSSRRCLSEATSFLVRGACVRSLSCESHPACGDEDGFCKEGIYFGDPERGHALSFFFTLKDAKARGFKRAFSVVVFSFDRAYLLTAWKVVSAQVEKFVRFASAKAREVSEGDQLIGCEKAARLKRRNLGSDAHVRSIVDITGVKDIFVRFHENFVWTLKTTHARFEEHPVRPPAEARTSVPVWCDLSPCVRLLRRVVSGASESDLAFGLPAFLDAFVSGRGPVLLFAGSSCHEDTCCAVLALAELSPEGVTRVKVVAESELSGPEVDPNKFDLVGVACSRSRLSCQLPSAVGSLRNVEWVDVPAIATAVPQDVSVAFVGRPGGETKPPEYVAKIAAAVADPSLSVTVVASMVLALKQGVVNKARAFSAVRQSQPSWSDQKILNALSLSGSDLSLYHHWSSVFA